MMRRLIILVTVCMFAALALMSPARAQSTASGTSQVSLRERLSPSGILMREARWVTLNGQRVLVAPISATARTASASPGPIPWESLRNVGTGLCLSSYPHKVGHGVEQYPCNGSYNQSWVLILDGPAWALANRGMVINTSQGPSNGCLDNRGGEVFANGNSQIMWPCYGAGWNLGLTYSSGGGHIPNTTIIHTNHFAFHGGKTWCVTSYPNKSPGSTMAEWICNTYSPNQSFYSAYN